MRKRLKDRCARRITAICSTLALSLALAAAALVHPALAQDKAEGVTSFEGKQIRMIVGSAPGGGYDLYARTVAAHLRQHLPGNPTIVVQNMPGAGSLVPANYLYNVAPKDGTVIGAIDPLISTDPLFYPDRAKFDPRQFGWIGSALRETHVGVVWQTSPIKTFDDVFKNELVVAGTGGSTNLYPTFVDGLLGTRIKVISGYNGTKQGMLAVERGEVGGEVGITWASLKATNGEWLHDGKLRVFAQFGLKRQPDLPDISLVYDYARNADEKAAMNLMFANQEFGRPFVAPPGVPAPVLATLREAFAATMTDPDFLADAKRLALDIDPTSGEEVQSIVENIFNTSPATVQKVEAILNDTAKN
jgi:tripartite-type tricarboxylate transporter receptor subunit TctC